MSAPPTSKAGAGVVDPSRARQYGAIRRRTEQLADPLGAEDQCIQSMPDTSPTKWHRAHTTWFFETFVLDGVAAYRDFDPAYGYLFNSYYDAVGSRHPRAERGLISRPGVAEIADYRAHVDAAMTTLVDLDAPRVAPIVELGLNHEQQHQELLLMDIKHVLSCNPLDPVYVPEPAADAAFTPRATRWAPHPGGVVAVGHAGPGFAFDNESPCHEVLVGAFELADRLVTAGEWLEFIEDGGYTTPTLWLSDGWHHAQGDGWEAPAYWRRGDDGDWSVFTLSGRRPVRADEPVCHVSYYEADAFARWAGARLATEVEWEAAAGGCATAPVRSDGSRALRATDGHFADDGSLHPRPAAGAGLRQMFGDCWEWTASPYTAYPGYRPPEGAVGEYNGKFMVNQMVLRGGSCLTPAGHVRPTYRNFFHPWTRWHASGVRLARDA